MRLFNRKKEESESQRHELCDIPVGSMVELSDTTTFALEEKTTQTFELKAYKKYEAEGFLRYMYQLVDEEEIILGVNMDPGSGEYELARFVIDSEEEFEEALGDTIMMEFDDPENEGETVPVKYERDNIVSVKMTVVAADGTEEYNDIELQEYSGDDGSVLSAELWESWFTFYIGELIERADVNIFPIEPSTD
jgi:hypothetical protein